MKSAVISDCLRYRYRLTRGRGRLLPIVMLNPSMADASVDDPTVRRLMGFAGRGLVTSSGRRQPHYDGIDIINLYALRSTEPAGLWSVDDPYGPDNRDMHHRFCRQYTTDIILAWGQHARPEGVKRFTDVLRQYIGDRNLVSCFGTNKNGSPKHPLYLSYDSPLEPYFIG